MGKGSVVVGYGHTGPAAADMQVGQRIGFARVETLFFNDINTAQTTVRNRFAKVGVALSKNEFTALVDLVFNSKAGVLNKTMSPNLSAAIDAGDYAAMAENLRYTKTDEPGRANGLPKRSSDRKDLFTGRAR